MAASQVEGIERPALGRGQPASRAVPREDQFFGRYAALCACVTLALFVAQLIIAPGSERLGLLLVGGLAGAIVGMSALFIRRGLSRELFLTAGFVLMALGVAAGATLPDGLDGAAVLPLAGALLVLPFLRNRSLFAVFVLAFGASMGGEAAAFLAGNTTSATGINEGLSLAESAVMLAFTYGLTWWVSNQWRAASARTDELLERQRQVLGLNERLLATLDPQQVLGVIADSLRAVVPYDNLTIYRADRPARIFRPVLARDRFAEIILENTFPLDHGITGWVMTHGEAQCVNDAQLDPRMGLIPGTPAEEESLIVVPLIGESGVAGTLNVGRMGGAASHFDASEFAAAQLFASQASIAVLNAERHREVRTRAETDGLTGLRNRRTFDEDIAGYLADPTTWPLTMLMLDLDGFKSFNDRQGHPAGDLLLGGVARALTTTVRGTDRPYRYGGDEFAVLLPNTARDVGLLVAGRVAAAIAGLDTGAGAPVTASFGAACHPDDATTRDDLVAVADVALYRAKASGGNQVATREAVVAPPPVAVPAH